MSVLVAAMLMQGVVRISAPAPTVPIVDPAPVFATFRQACVEPFPDPAGFARAVAAMPTLTRRQPSTELERLIPGEIWHSPAMTVRYTATMPVADLPAPQCSVSAIAAVGTDQDSLILEFASSAGLAAPKLRGRSGTRMAKWNSDRGGGTRWRTIFTTEARDGYIELRLVQMNLGKGK